MAYSGTTTFAVTGKQICTRAAAKLLVIDTSNGEVLDSQTLSDFLFQLNAIAKETMASPGVIPWTTQLNTLFLQHGQSSYALGPATTDHWTSSFSYATLANAYTTGDTSLVLTGLTKDIDTETAGTITAGDQIGIKLNSGVTHWTTVVSWTSGTNTVVITTGLAGPANAGNFVYDYTTTSDRPQDIIAIARSNTDLIDNFLTPISLDAYNQLPNKQQLGMPINTYFNSGIPNVQLYVWQAQDGTLGWDRLSCWCDMLIEDFDAAGADNPYYPIEWANYLIYQLAVEMADEYELADTKIQRLMQIADRKYGNLLNYSAQLSDSPIQFGMVQNAWSVRDRS